MLKSASRGVSAPRGGVVSAPGCVSTLGCLLPEGCLLWEGEGCLLGGVCSQGVSGPGRKWGCALGGCLLRGGVCSGGISQHAPEADTPPVDRQTPVKILPWPNFVAAGKNALSALSGT